MSCAHAFADVARNGDDLRIRVRRLRFFATNAARRCLDPTPRTIAVTNAIADALRRLTIEYSISRGAHFFDVVGMRKLARRTPDQFCWRISKQFAARRRNIEITIIGSMTRDHIGRVVAQQTVAMFADAQNFLDAHAFGNVALQAEKLNDMADGTKNRTENNLVPPRRAIFAVIEHATAERLRVFNGFAHRADDIAVGVGALQKAAVSPYAFFKRVTGNCAKRRIDEYQRIIRQARIAHGDAMRRMLDGRKSHAR